MNPLASLIALFASMKADLSTRFNTALASRPPLESVEGANVALGVLRELDWAKERMERLGTELNATLSAASSVIPGFEFRSGEPVEQAAERLLTKIGEDTASKALSLAIAAKTHLPLEDHQAAIDNAIIHAKADARAEAETEFHAKLEEINLIATRRASAIDKLGLHAAAALSDTDLLAEDHESRVTRIEERVTQLAGLGITPEAKPKSFSSLMACAMDEGGSHEFEVRLETLKEASGGISLHAAAPRPATPAGTLPSGGGDSRKKFVI